MRTNFFKGAWLLFFAIVTSACLYEDIPRTTKPDLSVCEGTDLFVSATSEPVSGCGEANGSITSVARGGSGTYSFSRDGGATKQPSGTFENLTGGTYLIIVFDGSVCTDTTEVSIATTGTDFQANVKAVAPDDDCLSENGSIEVLASGGSGSFTFQLGAETNSTGIFSNLAGGSYTIAVDDGSCAVNLSATVNSTNSVSYVQDIAPILTAKCNDSKCHGDGSAQTHLTTYNNVKANAADIKLRTGSGTMPKMPAPGGYLTAAQIDLIACWVDAGALNN